jgi:methionyl-tRNA synthetase
MDDTLEPIENVVPINIEDPLAAQDKVQYVEDKKEIYPDVNIFKTCPNCGNKLEPNAKACFLCGKRLDDENS